MWSWIAGTSSVVVLVVMGRKYWWAPITGLATMVLWFIYAFVDKQFGLLPCVVAYAVVHAINSVKWYRER